MSPVAVIDIGSGAAKLLVADEATVIGGEPLEWASAKIDLLVGGNTITDADLAAIGQALDRFDKLMARHQPSTVTVVGTAWARKADGVEKVAALVEERLGVPLEVLTGEREAELCYRGATAGRSLDGPVALIDVGAGSTEFAVGDRSTCTGVLSLDVGGRTLCEQYIESDPPTPAELSAALSVVELYVDDLRRELPEFVEAVAADNAVVVGVGAIKVIAEVEIGLPDPDAESVDGYRMDKEAVEEVFRALATESIEDRSHNPGLRPGDVVDSVGALCVTVEIMRQLSIDEFLISERGLSIAIAADLLDG